MSFLNCGFIGLGLIGGSIAKAIKQSAPGTKITAFDISKTTLSLAQKEGIADVITDQIDECFTDCDYLFLCAPVQKNDGNLSKVKTIIQNSDCLLTDVGSVKTAIHDAVHDAGLDHRFIGGHPMAGSEKTGFANANPILLENAYYILTPTEMVRQEAVAEYYSLVKKMGSIPMILSCQEHDYVTAAISHVPHLVAAALAWCMTMTLQTRR